MSLHRIVYGMYTHLSRSEIRMADPASLSDPITSTGPSTPLPLATGQRPQLDLAERPLTS